MCAIELLFQNRWSPTYDVAAILTSIQSLLDEPNPNSPANSHAAQLYQENRREYEKRVQQIVEQVTFFYRIGKQSPVADDSRRNKKGAIFIFPSLCSFIEVNGIFSIKKTY